MPTSTGFPASTTVVGAAAPTLATVVATTSSSIYVPQGGSATIGLDGTKFQEGAVADLGADISAGPASLDGTTRLTASITVLPTAALGSRSVTVDNPDGLSVTGP